jgi:Domain of unknown function (DUF397)
MNQRRDEHWRKSTRSATSRPNCVELLLASEGAWVRDSKRRSNELGFPASRLTMLLDAVKADRLGPECR